MIHNCIYYEKVAFRKKINVVIIGHPHTALSRTYQQSIILLRQDLLKVKPNFGFYVIVPGQKMLLFFLTREHMFSTIIVVQLY